MKAPPDLADLVFQGKLADPLALDYQLWRRDRLVLGWGTRQASLAAFQLAPGPGGQGVAAQAGATASRDATYLGHAAADVDGDGVAEIALLTLGPPAAGEAGVRLWLSYFRQDGSGLKCLGTALVAGGQAIAAPQESTRPTARIVGGRFLGATASFAVCRQDAGGNTMLELFSADAAGAPQSQACRVGPVSAPRAPDGATIQLGLFDIVAADVDGCGHDELSIVALDGPVFLYPQLVTPGWSGPVGWKATVGSYKFDPSGVGGTAVVDAQDAGSGGGFTYWQNQCDTHGSWLAIAAASSGGVTRLVVSILQRSHTSGDAGSQQAFNLDFLHVFQVDPAFTSLTRTDSQVRGEGDFNGYMVVSWATDVTGGDVDLDGNDEVIVARDMPGNVVLDIYKLSADGKLQLQGSDNAYPTPARPGLSWETTPPPQNMIEVGIASLWGGVPNAIVVSSEGQGVWYLPAPGCKVNPATQLQAAPADGARVHLVAADLDGSVVRVGPPRQLNLRQTNGVVAVLNQLPVEAGANDGGNTYLNFESQLVTGETTSLAVDAHNTWSMSDELAANGFYASIGIAIGATITRTYGQSWANTASQAFSITTGLSEQVTGDDVIIFSVTDYQAWEYPVMQDATNSPCGHLLVVFPNRNGKGYLITGGKDLSSGYIAPHQNGVIPSYSKALPADYADANLLFRGASTRLGEMQTQWQVVWGKTTEDSAQQTQSVEIQTSSTRSMSLFDGSVGFSETLSGSYSTSRTSTHNVTYQSTTTINLTYGPLSDMSTVYEVSPVVYWSTQGGFLVIDYVVTVPSPRTAHWKKYEAANPTFNFQWLDGTAGDQFKAYTRSIVFRDQPDGSTTLEVRVTNQSLADSQHVRVQVFEGDPDHGGKALGDPADIGPIESQSVGRLELKLARPQPGTIFWCVIKYAGADDVKGYNQYPYLTTGPSAAERKP